MNKKKNKTWFLCVCEHFWCNLHRMDLNQSFTMEQHPYANAKRFTDHFWALSFTISNGKFLFFDLLDCLCVCTTPYFIELHGLSSYSQTGRNATSPVSHIASGLCGPQLKQQSAWIFLHHPRLWLNLKEKEHAHTSTQTHTHPHKHTHTHAHRQLSITLHPLYKCLVNHILIST